MTSIWDTLEDVEEAQLKEVEQPKKLPIGMPPMKTQEMFDWEQLPNEAEEASLPEEEESPLKSRFRDLAQAPLGYIKKFPASWVPDLVKMFSGGASEEIIKDLAENDPDLIISVAKEARDKGLEYIPTQDLAEKLIEKHTGIPLVAKTDLQKNIRLSGTAAGFSPGGLAGKAAASITAPSVNVGLKEKLGLPEEISEPISLLASQGPGIAKELLRRPGNKTAQLETRILGEPLPKNLYEAPEQLLKSFQSQEEKNIADALQNLQKTGEKAQFPTKVAKEALKQPTTERSPLQSRAKLFGKDAGVRPGVAIEKDPSLNNQVKRVFSGDDFYNTTEAGKTIKNEILNNDTTAYKKVGEKYKIAEQLNSPIENIHPDLVDNLINEAKKLKEIPSRSGPQNEKLKSINKIINRLATKNEKGEITGYKTASNQMLYEQIKSLRQKIDYDFAHGDANNIFKPLMKEIEESIIFSSEQSGDQAAVKAAKDAASSYKKWAQEFDNPYIRPLRDKSNQDYSKIYKGLLDVDEMNVLGTALNQSEKGKALFNTSKGELARKNLKRFMENPRKVNIEEFNESLRELEAVITPEETQKIKEAFKKAKELPAINFRASKLSEPPSTTEKAASKFLKMEVEDVQSMLNKRSGIKELRELSKTETQKKLFDTMTRQKVRSILREGNIEKDFTGNELYQFLNKEKNYEILSEIIGEEATEEARLVAKELGKKQMRLDTLKKIGQKAGAVKFLHTIYPLIL